MKKNLNVEIQLATKDDLEEILRWLKEEEKAHPEGEGFYCNRQPIKNCFEENGLFVAKQTNGKTIGFITGPTNGPDILSVKKEHRNSGIGRQLAEFMIQKAKDEGQCVIKIEIAPPTAVPFWKKMGFEIKRTSEFGDIYGWLKLNYLFQLPEGEEVKVQIKFFPKERQWDDATHPAQEFETMARRSKDGMIHLEKRIAYTPSFFFQRMDCVVSVEIDNEMIFLDKAKYPNAIKLGFQRQSRSIFIDQIHQPNKAFKDALNSFSPCSQISTTFENLLGLVQNHSNRFEEIAYRKISRKLGGKKRHGHRPIDLDFSLEYAGIHGFVLVLHSLGKDGEVVINHFLANVIESIKPIILKRFPDHKGTDLVIEALLINDFTKLPDFLFPEHPSFNRTEHEFRRVVENIRGASRSSRHIALEEAAYVKIFENFKLNSTKEFNELKDLENLICEEDQKLEELAWKYFQ